MLTEDYLFFRFPVSMAATAFFFAALAHYLYPAYIIPSAIGGAILGFLVTLSNYLGDKD